MRVGGITVILFVLVCLLISCGESNKGTHGEAKVLRDTIVVYRDMQTQHAKEKKAAPYSKEEKEIRTMIEQMHASWQSMIDKKDEQEILQYFAPSYITNQVSVYVDNRGDIQSFTNQDFPKYLKSVIKRKGYNYAFNDVRFLDIEVKDQSYFNTVYKSKLIEKDAEGNQTINSLTITVTGKKLNGNWKIGNYAWVNFEYE